MDSENETSSENEEAFNDITQSDTDEEMMENPEGFHFVSLDPNQIVECMSESVENVASILQINSTSCRLLLHHFNWNKETLLDAYYESDTEQLLKKAGIFVQPKVGADGAKSSRKETAKNSAFGMKKACTICYQPVSKSEMTGLECGHTFCLHCWGHYLKTKVLDEGKGQTISCPSHGCSILVSDTIAMKLLQDSKAKKRYQCWLTKSFVESNRLMCWCPNHGCDCAIKVNFYDMKAVTCRCMTTFCFICGNQWHAPISCRLLKLWIKKCNDDSETSNWIVSNTKDCPKCAVTIEKNGGCNHMVCWSCQYDFCWHCLGSYCSHGGCNRYVEDNSIDQQNSRASLQRYLHYYNRYANHHQSMKLEINLRNNVNAKIQEMLRNNVSWIHVKFLEEAVDVLGECRRILMYTYAFAFYLKKNNQSIIFEDNQSDLEIATEQLSGFLERNLDINNLSTMKQKVLDKYRYCEYRTKVLLVHCHEGEEMDWWEYTA